MSSESDSAHDGDQPKEVAGSADLQHGDEPQLLETLAGDEDELLEACLSSFEPHAPVKDPRELVRFLPGPHHESAQFILNELIKLDMAAKSEAGEVPKIEIYTQAIPELLSANDVPVDLVMEEIQLRKESGADPSAQSYAQRFPQFESILAPLLGVASEATSAPQSRGAPPQLEIGTTLDDFLIIQTLGSGAFAYVYLARQLSMQRLVALKVSRGTGDEPQALAQFDHPNVVRVYDQRELINPRVHLLYMQYLPGGTLSDVVKLARGYDAKDRNGMIILDAVDRQLLKAAQAVPERSAVRKWLSKEANDWASVIAWLGVQLSRALDVAHKNEVFHRDVKPANVLLTPEGIPKLADFNVSFAGVAGRAGAAASFGGSIGYMSPEHLRAISPESLAAPEEVRESADLYSLAILLWELWQGHRPFDCTSAPNSWTNAIGTQLDARNSELVEPTRTGSATERVLESTLRLALKPDKEDRPSSCAAFAGRLKLALYPEAAKIFQPAGDGVLAKFLTGKWAVWAIAVPIILVPNIAMMFVNFQFNDISMGEIASQGVAMQNSGLDLQDPTLAEHIASETSELKGQLSTFLRDLRAKVDAFVLPLGILIAMLRILPAARALHDAEHGRPVTDRGIQATFYLCQHAALLGTMLWGVTGVFYAFVFWFKYDFFFVSNAVQFFMSLVVCGGIAATYPFFGMALIATNVLYPRLVRETMVDDEFDVRREKMIKRAEFWLLAGCGVPLMGIGLLVTKIGSHQGASGFLYSLVAFTAFGLVASFFAYRKLLERWRKMATVLSPQAASSIPALQDEE